MSGAAARHRFGRMCARGQHGQGARGPSPPARSTCSIGPETLGALLLPAARDTGASVSGIYLFPPDRPVLQLAVTTGGTTVALWERVDPGGEGPVAEAVRERRLVWVMRPRGAGPPLPPDRAHPALPRGGGGRTGDHRRHHMGRAGVPVARYASATAEHPRTRRGRHRLRPCGRVPAAGSRRRAPGPPRGTSARSGPAPGPYARTGGGAGRRRSRRPPSRGLSGARPGQPDHLHRRHRP